MKKLFIFFTILFIVGGSAFLVFKQNKYDFKAASIKGDIMISDFKDEYKILYFGYLFCPDVCPTTLFTLSNVLADIDRKDIKVLFITLDPDRDDVKELDEFIQNFYKNSVGLKAKNLTKVTNRYGVKYKNIPMPDSAMKYSVAHSSAIYLLDKDSKFFAEVSNLTEDEIKESILNLLSASR